MAEKETQMGMRLNKYIAHCGICNRREAVDLIKDGLVTVNDNIITSPAYLVQESEVVKYKNEIVEPLTPKFYVLMNKPKNVSVQAGEGARKSVLDIVQPKYDQPLTPIGRMHNQDVGLLLLTNDKEVIEKFALPEAEFIRVYHLHLVLDITSAELHNIKAIKEVDDKQINISNIDFLDQENKQDIGIELIQGSIDQIRSLLESMNYSIEKIDCMNFANLTKKDLPRGWFRDLKPKEVVLLKHFV